ncbi:hypothetical protein M378DRAFT_160341 [Amanita muscaria Koide BX008]|uniref:Uncharacterized protein n=1 Tax=Amanita muscaria (strain Koide BX008) TaxID=946122 RepID=A0A0C2XBT7_AMAMK|nr:hypothetical protein M378DRAFT_160341 [Amanita muscaria Koide BX008]
MDDERNCVDEEMVVRIYRRDALVMLSQRVSCYLTYRFYLLLPLDIVPDDPTLIKSIM